MPNIPCMDHGSSHGDILSDISTELGTLWWGFTWCRCRAVREFMESCLDVSENRGTPKSSILIGFSIINHPFWGTLFLETLVSEAKNLWNPAEMDSIIGWFVRKVGRCVNFECVHIFGSMSGSIWFGSKWIPQCIELSSIQSKFDRTIQSSKYQAWNANVSRAMSYIYLFDWLYLCIINIYIYDLILYNIPIFHANVPFSSFKN